jgi:hypothetical protein
MRILLAAPILALIAAGCAGIGSSNLLAQPYTSTVHAEQQSDPYLRQQQHDARPDGYSEKVLWNFEPDSNTPDGTLLLTSSGDELIGADYLSSSSGIAQGFFKITTSGNEWTNLYRLTNNEVDGFYANLGLTRDNSGDLFGTAFEGGGEASGGSANCFGNGCGTVFELKPSLLGYTFVLLHTFQQNGTDGLLPDSNLAIDSSGNLYGTTITGGNESCALNYVRGCGTVYELAHSGSTFSYKILYDFKGTIDGSFPEAGVTIGSGGVLYGTTAGGGGFSDGIVFSLTPSGSTYTEAKLYGFRGVANGDGAAPMSNLYIDASGALYGGTYVGGSSSCGYTQGCGTLFKLAKSTSSGSKYTEKWVYDFTVPYTFVYGLIADSSGELYGTTNTVQNLIPLTTGPNSAWLSKVKISTTFGGRLPSPASSSSGYGTVFKTDPSSGTTTIIHSFQGPPDGSQPSGSLTLTSSNKLFGVTFNGGTGACASGGCGTIFEITKTSSAQRKV